MGAKPRAALCVLFKWKANLMSVNFKVDLRGADLRLISVEQIAQGANLSQAWIVPSRSFNLKRQIAR